MPNPYKFFISHSSETKEIARHIFYLAVANRVAVWYDQALLELGDNVKELLRAGVETSENFLLLHSKPAMKSKWVAYEMELAEERSVKDRSFRRIAIKLDDEPLPESWEPYLYSSWNKEDLPGSIMGLLSEVIGIKSLVMLEGMALLNAETSKIFKNESATIAEQSRNYVVYYLAHIKKILSALNEAGYTHELRDSLDKILQLSIFANIPVLHGGIFPIEPGIYEVIYSNRMVKPPTIKLIHLPDRYSYNILSNNEISCKVSITDSSTGEIVRHPVPTAFHFELDARL